MRNSTTAEQVCSECFENLDRKTQTYLKYEIVPYMIDSLEKESNWFIWSVYGTNKTSFYNPITHLDAYAYTYLLELMDKRKVFLSVYVISNNAFPDKDLKNNKQTILDSFPFLKAENLSIQSGKHGADAFFKLPEETSLTLSAVPSSDDENTITEYQKTTKIIKGPYGGISIEIGTYNMIRLLFDIYIDNLNILRIPYKPNNKILQNKAFLYSLDSNYRLEIMNKITGAKKRDGKTIYEELMRQKKLLDACSYNVRKVNPNQLSLF